MPDTHAAMMAFTGFLAKMSWAEYLGYFAALLSITANSMRTMIPLRCLGIVTNVVSIIYGLFAAIYPTLLVHLILLPLNTARLVQMLQLVRSVKEAAACGDVSMEWLRPFMTRRAIGAGEVLFRKGETAESLYYILDGRFRLKESGIEIPRAKLVGEMGFLSPDNRRTQTLECVEGGEVLSLTYDDLRQLYFQNPEFGFFFLKLTSGRLFQNLAQLEAEVVRLRQAQALKVA